MTVFIVRHITTYRYKREIRFGRHQLMARPRDNFDQRLINFSLDVTPKPLEVRWLHDVFGNCVAHVDFDCVSDHLRFEYVIKLDHTHENAPDFRIEDHAKDHPFAYHDEEAPDLAPYVQRWFSDPKDDVGRWLDTFLASGTRRSTGQVLMTLNEAISDGFAYDRRTAPGTQSPSTTLELRKGTCRDFAVLMMKPRALGVSPRALSPAISTYRIAMDLPGWEGEPPMPGARFTSPVRAGSSSIRPMESSETEI
jgi:transglutaminase-like putative cysteine protease